MKGTTAAEAEREARAVARISGLDASAIVRKPLANRTARAPLDDDPSIAGRSEADARAIVAESIERLGDQANSPATVKDLFEIAVAMAIETELDAMADTRQLVGKMKAEHAATVAALQLENAQLKAALAEVRATQNEHTFVLERLKIDRRGPPGLPGPVGRDGRDGVGKSGPPGPAGPKGEAAPLVSNWNVDERAFTATPLTGAGQPAGATLRLRGLFEAFSEAIHDADVAEEADAAAASRAAVEREADNVRRGLPAR